MLRIIQVVVAVGAVVTMAACGGGGDSEVAVSNPLKKYEGTYASCDGNQKEKLTITATGSNSIAMSYSEEIYQGDNCTGAIVGTFSLPQPVIATFTAQTTANFPHVTIMPRTDIVDGVTISTPAMTAQLTGSGVSGSCVNFANGNVCYDDLTYPALTQSGAAYLREDYLVTFSLLNGILAADGIYSKNLAFNVSTLVAN